VRRYLPRFLRSESGSTTAEYALLLAVLAAAVIAAVTAFRPAAEQRFRSTGTTVGTYGVPDED
jgi:Flp pilus assembly pilin Flp